MLALTYFERALEYETPGKTEDTTARVHAAAKEVVDRVKLCLYECRLDCDADGHTASLKVDVVKCKDLSELAVAVLPVFRGLSSFEIGGAARLVLDTNRHLHNFLSVDDTSTRLSRSMVEAECNAAVRDLQTFSTGATPQDLEEWVKTVIELLHTVWE